MDSKAKLFSLSSFMLDRKKVLISFNFEKLHSPEATVTGIVKQSNRNIWESLMQTIHV